VQRSNIPTRPPRVRPHTVQQPQQRHEQQPRPQPLLLDPPITAEQPAASPNHHSPSCGLPEVEPRVQRSNLPTRPTTSGLNIHRASAAAAAHVATSASTNNHQLTTKPNHSSQQSHPTITYPAAVCQKFSPVCSAATFPPGHPASVHRRTLCNSRSSTTSSTPQHSTTT
jgi:hypothetical protein